MSCVLATPPVPDPVRSGELVGGHQSVNLKSEITSCKLLQHPVTSATSSRARRRRPDAANRLLAKALDPAAEQTLFAGTLIDSAGKKATTVAGAIGVLAFDVTTDATDQLGATIYTSGSFPPSRIEAANPTLTLDAAAIADLRSKNIYLERSIPITEAAVAPAEAEAPAASQ